MMSLTYCHLPLPTRPATSLGAAANAAHWLPCRPQLPGNVRLLTPLPEPLHNTRFVLSGRLSDVCAALDHLASQEQLSERRLQAVR